MTRERTRLGGERGREAEALILSDPAFPADPFAR
jgi:hypothetical protein